MARSTDITVRSIPPESWDEVVRSFPDHSVFHTLPWLRALQEEHRLKVHLAAAERNREVVAVWPCLSARKGPLTVMGSPLKGWSTAYMGPLIRPECDEPEAVLEAMLREPPLRRWSYFNGRVFDRERDIDLSPMGFTRLHREETYLLNLELSEDELWSNLKGQCRSRIRKARKLGIEVQPEHDLAFLDDFWTASEEVFAKYNITPTYSRRFVETMHRALTAVDRLYVSSALLDGKRISMLVLPYDEHTMYYWGGATYDEHRSLPAGNLLHWEAILHAKSLGLRTYDFINTKGRPGQFKKTFGPDAVNVATHWEASRSKLISMLKERYRAMLLKRRRVTSA